MNDSTKRGRTFCHDPTVTYIIVSNFETSQIFRKSNCNKVFDWEQKQNINRMLNKFGISATARDTKTSGHSNLYLKHQLVSALLKKEFVSHITFTGH